MHRFIRTTLAVALALSCAQLATAADESLKGRAEASFAHTSGNTDTRTLAAQIKGSYEAGVNRFFLRGAALYGKTEGVETSNRWLAEGRYERAITERFFAFLETSYFKDKFAGFDSKIQAGPGVGYDVIKTDRQILKLLVSALYTWDNYTDGTDDAYATGKAAGDYAWQITDTLTQAVRRLPGVGRRHEHVLRQRPHGARSQGGRQHLARAELSGGLSE